MSYKELSIDQKNEILLSQYTEKAKAMIVGEDINLLYSQGKYIELYHRMDELNELIRKCKLIYWDKYMKSPQSNIGNNNGLTSPIKTS